MSEWSARRIAVEVAAGDPATLIIASSRLPGWSAELNGQPIEPGTANEAFWAVPLPAQAATVTLAYQPPGVAMGLWAAVAGMVTLLGASLAARSAMRSGRRRATS